MQQQLAGKSEKQTCVALSTAEVQHIALASSIQEAIWIKRFIYEHNLSTICLAKNPQNHGRAKHIDIKYHFIREQITSGKIKFEFCKSEEMVANEFTKGLSNLHFLTLRDKFGVEE